MNPTVSVDWPHVVSRIQQDDPSGMDELYEVLRLFVKYRFLRFVGQDDIKDLTHECFVAIVESIRRTGLREPEKMIGFIDTVCRRTMWEYIRVNLSNGIVNYKEIRNGDNGFVVQTYQELMGSIPASGKNPEELLLNTEIRALSFSVINSLRKTTYMEILTRFYILEESRENIIKAMDITGAQYRLWKSRAKAKFAKRMHERMRQKKAA